MSIDFRRFIAELPAGLDAHRADGGYSRFSGGAADLYGIADALGILASLNALPRHVDSLAARVRHLGNPDGSFADPSHGLMHSTASAVGALALLDTPPEPPAFLAELWQPEKVAPFLEGLDWSRPWSASHDAAGLLAIATMTRPLGDGWFDSYFEWLDDNVDAVTGLWPARNIGALADWPGLFGNLGCSYHFHFLYLFHGRPIPLAERVVDTCLELFAGTTAVSGSGSVGYPQLDWAYSTRRASEQSGYRATDVEAALLRVAEETSAALDAPSSSLTAELNDLHTLAAVVALIAELGRALPGHVETGGPLVSVTDIRPFI